MSKVTIAKMQEESFATDSEQYLDPKKVNVYRRIIEIPIVPRKMVEMIIKECDEHAKRNHSYGNFYAEQSLIFIKEYAEDLLRQFEGDEDEVDN